MGGRGRIEQQVFDSKTLPDLVWKYLVKDLIHVGDESGIRLHVVGRDANVTDGRQIRPIEQSCGELRRGVFVWVIERRVAQNGGYPPPLRWGCLCSRTDQPRPLKAQ